MASKTLPQLNSLPTVADNDLAAIWSGSGPLKKALMSSVRAYIAPSAQARDFLADPSAQYVNFTAPGTGAVTRNSRDKIAESISLLDFIPVNLHAGIRDGSNTTDLTAYIQSAFNAANARWIGGTFGGGAYEIYVPAGVYKHGALIWKKGVCLRGDGPDQSLMRLSGSNLVGFGCAADSSTATAADIISYIDISNIAFFSNEASPVGQVLFDVVGFTRVTFTNVYFATGLGIISTRCSNAIPASSGGPAQWHNEFISCRWEKISGTSGGTALLLGDTDPLKETITTWRFFGGYIKNTGGTGLNIQSAAGVSFYGVCFEGNTDAIILGSSGVGVRTTKNVEFTSCYWEANTVNYRIYTGCTGTKIDGGFITGGTASDATTLEPAGTNLDVQGQFRSRVGADLSDFWQLIMPTGADTAPTVVGADASVIPAWSMRNSAGETLSLRNNSSSSSATSKWELEFDGVVQARGGAVSFSVLPSTFRMAGTNDAIISSAGAPGSSAATQGALWLRTNGGKGTTLYQKTGPANTDWSATPVSTLYSQTLTPASVAANTTAEQTFTVTGLTTADMVLVNGPAPTAGTGIVGARVSAANTLALNFSNNTAGALTPAAGTYRIVAFVSG